MGKDSIAGAGPSVSSLGTNNYTAAGGIVTRCVCHGSSARSMGLSDACRSVPRTCTRLGRKSVCGRAFRTVTNIPDAQSLCFTANKSRFVIGVRTICRSCCLGRVSNKDGGDCHSAEQCGDIFGDVSYRCGGNSALGSLATKGAGRRAFITSTGSEGRRGSIATRGGDTMGPRNTTNCGAAMGKRSDAAGFRTA